MIQIVAFLLLVALSSAAQPARQAASLGVTAFAELAHRCAPEAPLGTLRTVVQSESNFSPFAEADAKGEDAM